MKYFTWRSFYLSTLFLFVGSSSLFAQIKLPKLISNGAIFQRDTELKIWGWASPQEKIELTFKGDIFTATTNSQGEWELILPPQKAGGPHQFIFKGSNEITLSNILFGEVWVCSGQSNMELTMNRLRDTYPEVIANSKNSQIRQFLVADKYDFKEAHSDFDSGEWKEANPESLMNFSGVAYFFAKDIYEKYDVPVGLINSALGGSPVEAWMSEDALREFPKAYEEMQRYKNDDLIASTEEKDQSRQKAWYQKLNTEDQGFQTGKEWFQKNLDDSPWKTMKLPNFWDELGLKNTNGVVWFRKHINLPKKWSAENNKLWLGRMVDQDHVYVNGHFVGTTGYQYPPRKYKVPDSLLNEGDNVITVRLISESGKGGFIKDKPYFLTNGKDTLDLKGDWKYRLGTKMEPLQGPTFIRWKPGGLYNKMIAPLLNYKIKGAIWYQGESNTNDPNSYFKTFPALIKNWRAKWDMGDFPFLFVQLANFMEETHEPVESDWAQLRQAQLQTLDLPNTGMAVITDIGEWNDIHPLNKRDVGKRLAQLSFGLAYKDENALTSPVPKNADFLTNRVEIEFNYLKEGLMSKNEKPLQTFEVSGDGKTFQMAQARLEGDKVIVHQKGIKNPVAVRYAWSNNPAKANLFSKEGLPVSPFELKKD
ncbi:sialate O-acetylesterase [Euzebyella marina]|uniref:Sialate O-acetylesterase n=1 Tax=Euzebyella marina TaxID=1761453 RepID=A0A3G2L298_9FLAO|nr:sialate O-acetylesterase [Euzebyella marina]AYN66326.1 sialate O-acetylesterase [Euzebyella marina]